MNVDPSGEAPRVTPAKAPFAISFRRLTRDDFGDLQRWLAAPHVSEWWGDPPDESGVEQQYGSLVDGTDPTLVFVIEISGRSVGMIQTYRLSDNPEYETAVGVKDAAGVDLFIGEKELLGKGLGKAVVSKFVKDVGWPTYSEVLRYMAGPSVRNVRSRRTFEAAGFSYVSIAEIQGETDPEVILVLERPSTS
jgi:aminoglycoside 6'-N-acetyltransferase